MFEGINVALITPFNNDLSVDYETLEKLVDFLCSKKVDGITVCGTTGETATLEKEEYIKIIDLVTKRAKLDDIKVIAGVGTNSYTKTIENIKIVEEIGVDGLLIVTPYYNKPSQNGIYKYFKLISENTELPIILYDIPGRTGVKIDNSIIEKLSKLPNIVGIKDATGDILSMYDIYQRCDKDFTILSGDDNLYYAQLNYGCKGVISVIANIYPEYLKDMTEKYHNGQIKESFNIFEKIYKISSNLYIEGNPTTVKAYMNLKEMIPNMKVRSPLSEVNYETIGILKNLINIDEL